MRYYFSSIKLIFLLMGLFSSSFGYIMNNEVKYPSRQSDGIYRYNFVIDDALTMSLWDDVRMKWGPVLKRVDGKYYARLKIVLSDCNSSFLVNEADYIKIIKGAGLHRHILTINDAFPSPPIVVPHNAQVEVTVHNKLVKEVVTIHWHGITQQNTFYMDGVPQLTQCAIAPGETFVYKFRATELGTHWYHSHSGEQRTEGLYGPLIVTDRYDDGSPVLLPSKDDDDAPRYGPSKETVPSFDKEFYFIVQDWHQEDSTEYHTITKWENHKFYYGYSNEEKCFLLNRMDDSSTTASVITNRETDAIMINGKVPIKD